MSGFGNLAGQVTFGAGRQARTGNQELVEICAEI